MIRLITGGVGQGKSAFAIQKYALAPQQIFDGNSINPVFDIHQYRCADNYDRLIKRLLEQGENPLSFTECLIRKNPDMIFIMNEIGGGIVPVEKQERLWREQVGKVGCLIAENAHTVIRMVCGIPVAVKKIPISFDLQEIL